MAAPRHRHQPRHRRRRSRRSLLAAALALVVAVVAGVAVLTDGPAAACAPDPSAGTALPAAKRGVGTWWFDGADRALAGAGASWFYTWKTNLDGLIRPAARFVPMIWGAADVTQPVPPDADTLLGFNEPDSPEQADMSVDEALRLWPALEATKLRLGSPAPSTGGTGWLDRFLAGARERGYRVDFVALHWYGADFADPARSVTDLCRFLTAAHERYRKPIWLTEYALADFTHGIDGARYPDAAQQGAFAAASLPMLDRLPFLERYAWFALSDSGSPYRTGLYTADGTPTPAGRAYQGPAVP